MKIFDQVKQANHRTMTTVRFHLCTAPRVIKLRERKKRIVVHSVVQGPWEERNGELVLNGSRVSTGKGYKRKPTGEGSDGGCTVQH